MGVEKIPHDTSEMSQNGIAKKRTLIRSVYATNPISDCRRVNPLPHTK